MLGEKEKSCCIKTVAPKLLYQNGKPSILIYSKVTLLVENSKFKFAQMHHLSSRVMQLR